MNKAAIFDVDGTILPRPSIEVRFVIYLVRKKLLSPASFSDALGQTVTHVLDRGVSLRNGPRYWLRGFHLKELEDWGCGFFESVIRARLIPTMVELLQTHRRQGYRTALLSGAPEFLLAPLADYLETDAMVGTRLLVDQAGRVPGSIEQPRPFGRGKIHHLLRLQSHLALDLRQSAGFANEGSDAYHLALLGLPVAVNPDRQLRQIARLLGWPTLRPQGNHRATVSED